MDTAAYWTALLTVVLVPPFLTLWFIIHPFVRHWRKVGPVVTYLAALAVIIPLIGVMLHYREPLLRVHFGVSWALIALAVPLLLASWYVALRRSKWLTPAIMFGLPELSPPDRRGKLITGGVYAQIRHPRYLEVGLSLAAIALFSNYLAAYIVLAAYVLVIYLVVLLEERELRERFGEEYEQYCRRVPRFTPRLWGRRNRDGQGT
jgi:protein-S-isoprenylcysteine O-methyltransferase Ste14